MVMKQNIEPFILAQKQKQLLMKVLLTIYAMIISNLQKYIGKSSGWIIDSVIDYVINISK